MNSRDERAAARDQRRNLQIPSIVVNHGLGRADIIRSRSPSPANPAPPPGVFNFPPPPVAGQFDNAMATEEQLQALRDQIRNEVRAEIRNETAANAASIPDLKGANQLVFKDECAIFYIGMVKLGTSNVMVTAFIVLIFMGQLRASHSKSWEYPFTQLR